MGGGVRILNGEKLGNWFKKYLYMSGIFELVTKTV